MPVHFLRNISSCNYSSFIMPTFEKEPIIMEKQTEIPSPQAKALSLFLMAYKTKNNAYKEKAKRINRLWDLVKKGELTKEEHMEEVNKTLDMYGGYEGVIEKTINYYIEKTGEWKSNGDDKYAKDANRIAKEILKK